MLPLLGGLLVFVVLALVLVGERVFEGGQRLPRPRRRSRPLPPPREHEETRLPR